MISANYFDGINGKLHPVTLGRGGDQLLLSGDGIQRQISLAATTVGEPLAAAPAILQFADGARCEVHDADAKAALFAALDYQKSFVQRWQDKWLGALLAIVAMLAMLALAYYRGVPWAAEQVASAIPAALEQQLGDQALAGLDRQLFLPSQLTDERKEMARTAFQRVLPASTRMPLSLLFRQSPALGANAFALPNGSIIVTDALIATITGPSHDLSGVQAEQFAAVLAHEVGHVQNRHALRLIIATSIGGAVSWTLFGDFSAVVAGAPALMLQLQFSRAMESEADDYAAVLLKQRNIPAARLAEALELLEANHKRNPSAALPGWLRKNTDYLTTHPATEQRMARMRAADQR